jgi:hypothetical protein
MTLELKSGLDFIKQHPIATGIGVGSLAIGGAALAVAATRKRKKKTKKSRKKNSVRYRSGTKKRKLKFGSKAYRKKYLSKRSKQRKPHTAGKRKDTSHKRIRYTKNNQPYIILANGKARFISKKSAGVSRKRKGGRY